jgi:hypothetical protein
LLVSHFGDAFPADEVIVAWVRHFDLMALTRLSLKPGVIELLDTLDDLQLPREKRSFSQGGPKDAMGRAARTWQLRRCI